MSIRIHRGLALLLLGLGLQTAWAGTFRDDGSAADAERGRRDDAKREAVADTSRGPSGGGVFLRSLLVPGWGESVVARAHPELGRPGRVPFLVDLGLAAAAVGLVHYGGVKRDEYQSYASRVAGAGPHADDSDFWVDVSNHASVETYNTAMLQNGNPAARYTEEGDSWAWPSSAERGRYRDLRAVSEDAYSRALALGGAMVVNHLLSAVRANRLLRRSNLDLEAALAPGGAGLRVGFDLGRLLPRDRSASLR